MDAVKSYKDLLAYQKSYHLVLRVYELTGTFPKEEIYGLTSQIRRAAVSITSNIAEGAVRGSRDYLHFLKMSLGSAAELETQLSLYMDLGYCDRGTGEHVFSLTNEVLRLLNTYIRSMAKRLAHDRDAK